LNEVILLWVLQINHTIYLSLKQNSQWLYKILILLKIYILAAIILLLLVTKCVKIFTPFICHFWNFFSVFIGMKLSKPKWSNIDLLGSSNQSNVLDCYTILSNRMGTLKKCYILPTSSLHTISLIDGIHVFMCVCTRTWTLLQGKNDFFPKCVMFIVHGRF
jgi:hypothetical protein